MVFLEGCPCAVYTAIPKHGGRTESEITSDELCSRIMRLYPYIKDGGVTFSGGEPCLQADFVAECAKKLRENGLHIALDTSGEITGSSVGRMLEFIDLVILDVKGSDTASHREITGGGRLENTLAFLSLCEKMGKETWVRQVIVPGVNDSGESVLKLKEQLAPYSGIKKIELLPFRKLCAEKYGAMGLDFPYAGKPEMSLLRLEQLQKLI